MVGEQELDGNYYYQWTRDSHEDVFSSIPIPDKSHPKAVISLTYNLYTNACKDTAQKGSSFQEYFSAVFGNPRSAVREGLFVNHSALFCPGEKPWPSPQAAQKSPFDIIREDTL